jgi:hypothetical protein
VQKLDIIATRSAAVVASEMSSSDASIRRTTTGHPARACRRRSTSDASGLLVQSAQFAPGAPLHRRSVRWHRLPRQLPEWRHLHRAHHLPEVSMTKDEQDHVLSALAKLRA